MFEDPAEGPPRLVAAAPLPMNAPKKTPDPGSRQATPAAYGRASLAVPAPGRRRPKLRQRLHRFFQRPGPEVVVGGLIVASLAIDGGRLGRAPLAKHGRPRARQALELGIRVGAHPAHARLGEPGPPHAPAGSSFYRVDIPAAWAGKTFVELLVHLKEKPDALLITVRGASGEVVVNPSGHTFRGGDPIVVIATRELEV
jgi:hypothetical protein